MVNDLAQLRRSVSQRAVEVSSVLGKHAGLHEQLDRLLLREEELSAVIAAYEEAVTALNLIANERQVKSLETIESLVTMALVNVFNEPLSFHVVSTTKGKSVNVDFTVRTTLSDGTEIDTPLMSARGGGLVCVVGFILRLTVMMLRGEKNPVLILDETFGMLSDEYLENMAEFLRQAAEQTGAQVVMVTHQPAFAEHADVCYRLSQVDGKTIFERMR